MTRQHRQPSTTFILDVAQISTPGYREAHPEAIQGAAAITGTRGRTSVAFPRAGSTGVIMAFPQGPSRRVR